MNTYSKGTLAGITATMFWSCAASFIAAAQGVQPFLYYGTEMLIGFMIFVTHWLWRGHDPRPEWKAIPPWYILAGLIGIGLQGVAWVAAIQHAPPLEALLCIYQWPLLVVLFTALSLKQPLKALHFIALFLGFLGIITVLVGRGLDLGSFTITLGHLSGLIAALTWSVFSAISARHTQIPPSALALILLIGGIVNLMIWVIGFGAPLPPLSGYIICLIAAFVIMPGYILWDYGVKNGNARTIGFVSFLIPVFSSILLVVTKQAQFSWYTMLGLTIVMIALAVAKFYPQKLKA